MRGVDIRGVRRKENPPRRGYPGQPGRGKPPTSYPRQVRSPSLEVFRMQLYGTTADPMAIFLPPEGLLDCTSFPANISMAPQFYVSLVFLINLILQP